MTITSTTQAAASEEPAPGDFPFCFADKADKRDTLAVQHWRNRSQYLTRRGLQNYATVLYQYNRGMFGNLLVLSVPVFLIALILAQSYTWLRDHPFLTTVILIAALLGCHLADFVAHQNRPRQEFTVLRLVRWFLLGLLCIGLLVDGTPLLVEFIRSVKPRGTPGIPELLGLLGTAASVTSFFRVAAPRVWESRLTGRVALGLGTFCLITGILVGIVDFLYFGIPPYGWFLFIPFIAGGVIAASLLLPLLGRVPLFDRPVVRWLSFLAVTVAASCLAMRWAFEPYSLECRYAAQTVAEITRPLGRLARALERPTNASPDRLPQSDRELLNRLAEQRKRLNAEFNADWAEEYETLYLGTLLPRAQSLLTRFILEPSDNTPLYRALEKPARINEWSVLGPLRPHYHQHAVAFLNSCAALDKLDDDAKQILLEDVSLHCLSRVVGAIREADASRQEPATAPAGAMLDALLVHHLVATLLPDPFGPTLRFEPGGLGPLIAVAGPADATQADALVASLLNASAVDHALASAAVSPPDQDAYGKLLAKPPSAAAPAATEGKEPTAFSLQASLKEEAALLPRSIPRQYEILSEALLVCLCRLRQAEANDDFKKVQRLLEALPSERLAGGFFLPHKRLTGRFVQLMGLPAEDLAMLAAGYGPRDRKQPASAFVPEHYVADAFLQAVCDSINRPSRLGIATDGPKYHPLLPDDHSHGDEDADPALHDMRLAQLILLHRATLPSSIPATLAPGTAREATSILGQLFRPSVPTSHRFRENTNENDLIMSAVHEVGTGKAANRIEPAILVRLLAGRTVRDSLGSAAECEETLRIVGVGRYGNLEKLRSMVEEVAARTMRVKTWLMGLVMCAMAAFGLAFVDPNMTSIHRFYRDSLGSAFLIWTEWAAAHKGRHRFRIVERSDVRLSALQRPGGCAAPYPLINAALNVSAHGDESIRQRGARPFLFSPCYVGVDVAGSDEPQFIATAAFETCNPTITAASAMTISGAAASPMMGRYTNWLLRLPMVLTNVRLGYWVRLPACWTANLDTVKRGETEAIRERRKEAFATDGSDAATTDPAHVVGLAFSGGGIRSAALNFGIAQGLFRKDIWKFVDYLSTVSGGGYVGTSISIFMRAPPPQKPAAGDDSRQSSMASSSASSLCLFNEVFDNPLVLRPFTRRFANLSDGGHFENLGVYALLQRQCNLIIVGDGEADPKGVLDGLSRLSMLALSDLGVRLEFPEGDLGRIATAGTNSERHFTVARIRYRDNSTGWLIYLRSSVTGDEDEFIRGYKAKNDAFPHESTTDQFFTEEQFEAYRRLGEHIASDAIARIFVGQVPFDHDALITATKRFFTVRTRTLAASAPVSLPRT